ncbi:MAG: single-stranded DNA-binding protein [Candidatus Gracilibacteria bacterium]
MAYSLNRAQIIGNITRDPELKKIPSGTSVASFGVATNHSWKDASGQKQEKAEFHNIVAWGKLAEIVAQYTRKGSKVYIDGRIQTRDWTGDDGVKRYRTEIVAENLIILDSKGGASAVAAGLERDQQPIKEKEDIIEGAEDRVQEKEITVDDLPF